MDLAKDLLWFVVASSPTPLYIHLPTPTPTPTTMFVVVFLLHTLINTYIFILIIFSFKQM